MSERRKKKKEKQDEWFNALSGLHANIAQSAALVALKDSMNSFMREYGEILRPADQELMKDNIHSLMVMEHSLKRIGKYVMDESVRREQAVKTADENLILKIPTGWILHESARSYLIELPESSKDPENSIWIPKSVVREDRNGEISVRIYRSFSFEKVHYELHGTDYQRVSSSKISAEEVADLVREARETERLLKEQRRRKSPEETLAAELNAFAESFDTYDYRDRDSPPGKGYEEVLESLRNMETGGIREFLQSVIDDADPQADEAERLLEKIQKYEEDNGIVIKGSRGL